VVTKKTAGGNRIAEEFPWKRKPRGKTFLGGSEKKKTRRLTSARGEKGGAYHKATSMEAKKKVKWIA